ncbi:ATP-binding cassette sub-family B member 10, mitochondrial [Chelonus insularis]|uniref:ATP-binding cassette sub-family B member 10, mitochondrial n=1 Tax=Chelonus insularis TaxID=460826 RepID=UPI00158A39BB|nr:ATP-binding cassette sub-family B member 10, mitochondrial [Chelonus insularis]
MTQFSRMIVFSKLLRRVDYIKKINMCSKNIFYLLKSNTSNVKNFNIVRIYHTSVYKSNVNVFKNATSKDLQKLPKTINKSELKRLFELAKPERWKLMTAIGFLIVSSTVTMAVPFCVGKIIDVIYVEDKNKTKENLNRFCLILFGVSMIGGLCNFGRIYFMSTSGYRITQNLRKKAYSAILSQEAGMFDKMSTGELVGRLTGDAQLVSAAVTSNISDGLRSSITTIVGTSMMFYTSPPLALVGLSIVPIIAGLIITYGRIVRKISKDVQNSLAVLNTTAEEKISNIRTVKAFAQEQNEIKRYCLKLNDLLNLCYKESYYRGMFFGLFGFSGNAIVISVLYYGGFMLSDSSITIGNLSAFLMYAGYIGISLTGISKFYSELNRALGASTRLFELIERKPKIPFEGGKILDRPLTGDIIFQNINFAYPTREGNLILKDFSLHLSSCSINAIVGPSGSGKSTIALLLLRLYDPISGDILLDGNDMKILNPLWIKLQIGFVAQEPILFNGTIRENISYGTNEVNNNDIIEAARIANVLEFTEKMTDGLNTIVGERGVTLSGGQRQRIAIARALIKNPKILILDEATSALDAESENYVQEALERATKGRTVLIIAHRLSTIKNADKIAVLDQGRVIETGNYTDLMQIENGLFRRLIKYQTFS